MKKNILKSRFLALQDYDGLEGYLLHGIEFLRILEKKFEETKVKIRKLPLNSPHFN